MVSERGQTAFVASASSSGVSPPRRARLRRPDPAAPSAMPIDSYDSDAEGADELARGAEIRLRWDVKSPDPLRAGVEYNACGKSFALGQGREGTLRGTA